jgi:radical SAM superfamily enzyme YgiQ (UPF0313 family)
VADQAEHFKNNIRTGFDYVLPTNYYSNMDTLEECMSFVCRLFGGIRWTLKDFQIPYSPFSSEDIFKASADRAINPFVDFFESQMEAVKGFNPDLTGITVSWTSQIIPAFTLARTLKRHMPDMHITIGGSMISHLADYLKFKRNMFKFADSYMVFDGEEGILKLAETISTSGKLSDVPGLIYSEKKKIHSVPPVICSDLNRLPVPDYSDLELKKYYSPQIYLPIAASRGCYWGKCAFCTHHLSGMTYRSRNAESVFEEMKILHEKYNCKNFYFVDDAVPPALALNLSKLIKQEEKPFRWAAEFRAEKMMDDEYFNTLQQGGCRLALFGLESGCASTLGKMNKGWEMETISKAIRSCSDADIITWLFFMTGFPGESRIDALETFRFILGNNEYIDMIAGGTFVLTKNSQVFREPEKFGTEILPADKEIDMPIVFPYKVKDGIQKQEAEKLLEALRNEPGTQKFLSPFVAETHMLFFRKNYFRSKIKKQE